MWRDPDDIVEDLASGEPERIRLGLAGLVEFSKAGDEFELPAVGADLLRPFGAAPPPDVVLDLARLLWYFKSFVPAPSRSDVLRETTELAVRYGPSQVTYETFIQLLSGPEPQAQVREALEYLGRRGLSSPSEVDATIKLVDYLLDATHPGVSQAAVDALAAWPHTQATRKVIAALLPVMTKAQRTQLGDH